MAADEANRSNDLMMIQGRRWMGEKGKDRE
jgi:hypothetical protein